MLTPERRAELRGLAESAQPVIRHGGTDPAAVYVPATDISALLDAADEADRLQDVERRLAVLLCNLTGGKLSKPDYPVELMEQEIEEYLAVHHESDLRDERDRLAAERDAFIAGIGLTPAADLVELVEPLSKRIGDAVEHRQCAEELAWEKRQHEARMAEARESHERFLRDAHRVSDAYNTVARRVYRAAMKRRKTVRIADLLDGQPMVWPDGDE